MKMSAIALLIAACCLSVQGQFFSKEEQASKETAKPALKVKLSEADQKEVYIELCTAESKARSKAIQMHPVQIHHVPEKRAAQQQKAADTQATLFGYYKLEIAEQRGITTNCISQIEVNGKEKQWPRAVEKPPTK